VRHRVSWPALAGLVAALVGLGVALAAVVVFAGGSGSENGGIPRGIMARTSLSPRSAVFGTPLSAGIDVLVDRRFVVPGSVRIRASFGAWKPVGGIRRTQHRAGSVTEVQFVVRLECLTIRCIPPIKLRREVEFPLASVLYKPATGGPLGEVTVPWPVFSFGSNLTNTELAAHKQINPLRVSDLGASGLTMTQIVGSWRTEATAVPAATYRFPPEALAAALFAAAGLLALGSFLLIARRIPRPVAPRPQAVRARSPVERALDVLDVALANGHTGEQRKALELLGRALGGDGEPGLAYRARELAWAEPAFPRDEALALADDVRESVGGPNGHA
jgi:hypothetical protein